MALIKNLNKYPIKTPVEGDYYLGTDSENFGRTVSFLWTPSTEGGASPVIPAQHIVTGTGTGIGSSADFTYDGSNVTLRSGEIILDQSNVQARLAGDSINFHPLIASYTGEIPLIRFTDFEKVESMQLTAIYIGNSVVGMGINSNDPFTSGYSFVVEKDSGDVSLPKYDVSRAIGSPVFNIGLDNNGKLVKGALTNGGDALTTDPLSQFAFTTLAQLNSIMSDATLANKGFSDNFVTDAEKILLSNTSGTNTGNNAVNTLYSGLATSKQDTLVSGTNIKTVNGNSLLGSGDLIIANGAKTTTPDTGTTIDLSNVVGNDCNMLSANTNTVFTVTGSGGYAKVLVNSTSVAVTGGVLEIGATFLPSTDMYLVVYSDVSGTKYFFVNKLVGSSSGGKWSDGTDPLDAVYMTGNVGIGVADPLGKLHLPLGASNGIVFGDGDSGIYENTDDVIGIKAGTFGGILISGASPYSVSARVSSGFKIDSGTSATVPMYTHREDPDSGLAFNANNEVSLVTGGVAAISIDAAQNAVVAGNVSGNNLSGTNTGDNPGLENLSEDTTPQLGGELDMQAHSIGGTVQTATGDGATTIDWGSGNMFDFKFGAFNEVFTFTAPTKPGTFILKLEQDSVGSRTATFPATVKWPGGTAPTLTTTATTGTDIITLYWNGTSYFCVDALNFS